MRAGRRLLGASALTIVAYMLVLTPISVDGAGQFSQLLWLVWVVCASIALLRREPRHARATTAVAHA